MFTFLFLISVNAKSERGKTHGDGSVSRSTIDSASSTRIIGCLEVEPAMAALLRCLLDVSPKGRRHQVKPAAVLATRCMRDRM